MRNTFGLAAIVVVVLGIFVALGTIFTVSQTEQALVLRFGAPARAEGPIKTPGLHFKIPFIESVVKIDNRILDLESPKQEVLAADNQRIDVDAFVRYRIVDALRFYQAAGSVRAANNLLASVLNSAVRRVLGEATQTQIVSGERAALMVRIREQVDTEATRFGVQIVDARLRRADLPREISEKVFSRMQSERQREASEYRAQGQEQYQTITSRADRDVTVLRADAVRKAEQIRGAGDAERTKIFADAYGADKDFFSFWRSMQAYENAFKGGETRFVISPGSDFFRFFSSPTGAATPAAGSAR